MPHLTVHALDTDLSGRETELIAGLTDAVAAVYGEWARALVVVHLIGLPAHRWGVGGRPARDPAPAVTFHLREAVFRRPDADAVVARLVAGVTDAVAGAVGEHVRPGITVDLVADPAGRSAVGGSVVTE